VARNCLLLANVGTEEHVSAQDLKKCGPTLPRCRILADGGSVFLCFSEAVLEASPRRRAHRSLPAQRAGHRARGPAGANSSKLHA